MGNTPVLPLFREALPTLAAALKPSLLREGEVALAAQVDEAHIHALCYCGEPDCLTFFLAPPDDGPCLGDYRVVTPDAALTIGVCNERMERIEDYVMGRDDGASVARAAEYAELRGVVPRAMACC